jgi:sugar phosphate isomerase/epimerase
MKAKLACADFTFPLLDHTAALDLIALLKIKGVDIGLFEGRSHLQPSSEFINAKRSARRLKKKLDDRGLKAADIFLQLAEDFRAHAINHPHTLRRKKARERFLQSLEYATEAGAKHLTILPGALHAGETRRQSWDRAVEELAWRVEQAKRAGIVFGVEAHIGSLAPRPKAALQLVGEVPGLTLTLDYTHFTRLGIADAEVEPLIAHASHFHARGGRKGRLQERFARNTIDYSRIYRIMAETRYRGWIGIEYVWMDWEHCNECDNLSETVLFRDFFLSQSC